MVATQRRRQDVGEAASAALPVLWKELDKREWTHAKLAAELEEDPGKISKLLYGDRRPGRKLAAKLLERFSIALALWEEPVPKNWQPWKRAA
jgi:plasmid maintenance system antidote protein VapI